MQSVIKYNGVLIKDVCTEIIEYSSEKESTGVDQIGIRAQAVFTGVVHMADQDHTGIHLSDFRSGLHDILKKLSKDRRQFILTMGGREVIRVSPGAIDSPSSAQRTLDLDKMDIDNGPKVSVQVVKIVAGVSASIRFTISYTFPNCDDSAKGGPTGLVNFRFWVHEDIDCRTWLTMRTYVGRLRVSHKNISPHAIARQVSIPPLEDGFQRQIMSWHESADGLTLDFTFRDQEKIASAPWNKFAGVGAIDWDGQLTARTGNNFGFTGFIDFNLRLTGPKSTSKADLIKIGFFVANAKAKLFEATSAIIQPNAVIFLDSLQVTEELAENSIQMTATIRHTGSNIIDGVLSVGADQLLGRPMGDLGIGYNPEKFFIPDQTAGIAGLFLSALQTPCNPARMPKGQSTAVKSKPKVQSSKALQSEEPDTGFVPAVQSEMSASQLTNMYLEYLLDSEIIIRSGKIALATGGAADSTDESLAICNLHRPVAYRLIDIDATRLNDFPQFPAWSLKFSDDNGIIHTPIGDAVPKMQAPQISADNRKLIMRGQMHLVYALSRPPELGESLPVGCVPYRGSSPADPQRVIQAENFIQPSSLLT